MAAQLNKVLLVGNLTRDPELRRLPSGSAVTDLGLALNRTYTSKEGDRREEVTFVDISVWDRTAENCAEYLKKGSAVLVEGYLKMDQWDDKATGEKRSKLKVHAERVQFLDRKDAGGGGGGSGDDQYAAPARDSAPRRPFSEPRSGGNGGPPARGGYSNTPAPAPAARRPPAPPVDGDGEDDDIPF